MALRTEYQTTCRDIVFGRGPCPNGSKREALRLVEGMWDEVMKPSHTNFVTCPISLEPAKNEVKCGTSVGPKREKEG